MVDLLLKHGRLPESAPSKTGVPTSIFDCRATDSLVFGTPEFFDYLYEASGGWIMCSIPKKLKHKKD